MENRLKIEIEGDASELQKAVGQAEKSLNQLEKSQRKVQEGLKQAAQTTLNYEKQLSSLNNQLKQGTITQTQYDRASTAVIQKIAQSRENTRSYQREVQRLNQGIQRQRQVIDQAKVAVQNYVPAVQKAAVTTAQTNQQVTSLRNNIVASIAPTNVFATSLGRASTQFSQLTAKAGGASQAVKLIAGSFLGPAGIVIAITTAIGLLTSFIDLQKIGENIGNLFASSQTKAANALKQLNDEVDEYISKLQGVDKATLEGEKSAQKEIATVNTLVKIIEDETLSREKRLKAVDQLQSKYPNFLGNIEKEALLSGNAASAVSDLTDALIKKATASALEGDLVDVIGRQLELQRAQKGVNEEINKQKEKEADLERQLARIRQQRSDEGFLTQGSIDQFNRLNSELAKVQSTIQSLQSEDASIADILSGGEGALNELSGELANIQAEIIGLFDSPTKDKLTQSAGKAGKEAGLDYATKFLQSLDEGLSETELARRLQRNLELETRPIIQDVKIDVPFDVEQISAADQAYIDLLASQRKVTEEAEANLQKILNQTFAQSIANVYSELGRDIADSLGIGNQAVKTFLSTVLRATPAIISAIKTQAAAQKAAAAGQIATAKGVTLANIAQGASQSAAATGPFAAFVLPALLAGGLALVSGFFKGGTGGGGASTVSSVTGASGGNIGGAFSGNSLFDGLNLTTAIRGTDLELILTRTSENNQA